MFMSAVVLSCLAAAGLMTPASADHHEAAVIELAAIAAPPEPAKGATVMDREGNVLKLGDNGWTRGPIPPHLQETPPMCNEGVRMEWADAYFNEKGYSGGTFAKRSDPMITLRRAEERHHDRHRKEDVWSTFHPRGPGDARADRFGHLESLSESRLPSGAIASRDPHHDAEIVTYVREGALAYEDAPGSSGVIQAGEFQGTTAGRGIRRSETNASRSDGAHVFQLLLGSAEPGLVPGHELKRFTVAERRGRLCVVASPDARRGSLRIHQDALVCSAVLEPGQHVIHELSPGRTAWLHCVEGEVTLGDNVLTTGDGAGVTAERSVSLTAREETEILFVDLGEGPSWSPRKREEDS